LKWWSRQDSLNFVIGVTTKSKLAWIMMRTAFDIVFLERSDISLVEVIRGYLDVAILI